MEPPAEEEELAKDGDESLHRNQGETFRVLDEQLKPRILGFGRFISPEQQRSEYITSAQSQHSYLLSHNQSSEPSGPSNNLLQSWSPVDSSQMEGESVEKRDEAAVIPIVHHSPYRVSLLHPHLLLPMQPQSMPPVVYSPCPENSTSTGEKQKELTQPNRSDLLSILSTTPSWDVRSPYEPSHEMSGRGYFQPGSRSVQLYNSGLVLNYPTTLTPHLKQTPLSFGGESSDHYLPAYSPSSLSEIPSAKNRTLTQAEYVSNMSLDLAMKHIPKVTDDTDSSDSDCDTSERSKIKSAVKNKIKSKIHSSRRRKKSKNSSHSVASTVDFSDYMLDQPPPGTPTEPVIKTPSTAEDATPGHSQDDTRETELHETAGPSTLQHSSASDDCAFQNVLGQIRGLEDDDRWSYSPAVYTAASGENRYEIISVQSENVSGVESDAQMEMETFLTDVMSSVTNTWPTVMSSVTNTRPTVMSSVTNTWPTVSAGPRPHQLPDFMVDFSTLDREVQLVDGFLSYSPDVNNAGIGENINDKPQPSECEAGGDDDTLVKMESPVTAVSSSVTNNQPTRPHPKMTDDTGTSERSNIKSAVKHRRKSKCHSSRRMNKRKKSSHTVAFSSDYMLDQPPPGPPTEPVIKTPSTAADPTPGHSQDDTRETEQHATAGPSTFQPFTALDDSLSDSRKLLHEILDFQDYDSCSCSSDANTVESGDDINDKPQPFECEAGGDDDVLVKMEAPVTAVSSSVTNTQPTRPHLQLSSDPGWSQRGSSCLPRSHNVPSLSQISCAENKTFRPSQSLPDMLLKSSFEEFTPDITVDEDDESYRFRCSCPGLYQCSVTGLVFHMEGEGDVVYRIVSWDRRLLAQHHKKPAGPLFDIKCLQQSVCRLHLPHCEIPSTAGCPFLSVAHLNDEGIEFIPPQKITETHLIINISEFSGFGNVKDEDSPPEPVRALVLLFYRPADDQNLTSFLNVLMLPRNIVLRDVQRTRKKLVGDELYIETSSRCKLLPGQEHTLSTCPEDGSVLVQPKEAEFDEESYDNYIPSFQVTLKTVILNMKVLLRDTNSSHIVWEREVCLPSAGVKKHCVQSSSDQVLKDIRSSFIEGISGPGLKSLVDKLLEKEVLIDSERESADKMQNKREQARFVFDTVRDKGASSEMIEVLREVDPCLCKHLGLIVT